MIVWLLELPLLICAVIAFMVDWKLGVLALVIGVGLTPLCMKYGGKVKVRKPGKKGRVAVYVLEGAVLMGVLFTCISLTGCGSAPKQEAEPVDWAVTFEEKGFTEDEISSCKEILDTLGITDFHDVEITENGVMHIVRGKIFNSSNLQVNMTLENRAVIYVEIAGIPDTKTEAYINWRGKIKVKTVDTKTTAEMYSDTEGGYLAVLDWDTKTISEYEG